MIIRQANYCLLIDDDWSEISERKGGVPESLWHLRASIESKYRESKYRDTTS